MDEDGEAVMGCGLVIALFVAVLAGAFYSGLVLGGW
jgi:hypothetical protein